MVDLGTTLLSIYALIWGWPANVIVAVVSFVVTGSGVVRLAANAKRDQWKVEENWTKEVFVNGTTPYWSGKTIEWLAIVGDKGVAFDKDREYQSSDFNNNHLILQTGLDRYISGW